MAVSPTDQPTQDALRTPLHDRHLSCGGRMVVFAGYDMPVQYAGGIIAEHLHTRSRAGLFDVSHMGQVALHGPDHETIARALEALCPADVLGLKPGCQRYSQLTTSTGGVADDFMITRPAEGPPRLLLVLNASRKHDDGARIAAALPPGVALERREDRALVALQGPLAVMALARHAPGLEKLAFMQAGVLRIGGIAAEISRSGYTGDDGFEISVASADASALWDLLMAEPEVAPIGLGARDSLRLEAGLCLYGHELDETISPVEAGLQWSIGKRRRQEGGFPGAGRIQQELLQGPQRLRVGLRPEGRAPARDGAIITLADGCDIGVVTSGGFAPSLNAPIAMGYVRADQAAPETSVRLNVRGRELPARVCPMPFTPHHYVR